MDVSSQTWIVVAGDPGVAGLIAAARGLGAEVTALVAGPRGVADAVASSGVDRVLWLGEPAESTPVEAYAPDVARIVADAAPRAVLGASDGAGRVLLGAIAGRLQAPVLSGVMAIEADGAGVAVTRAVFGGIAERRDAVGSPALIALPGGDVVVAAGPPVPVAEVDATPLTTGRLTGLRRKEKAPVNLNAARTVVAVGRGLKAQADLALITDLAAAVGGELPAPGRSPRASTGSPRSATSGSPGSRSRPTCTWPSGSPASSSTWSGCGTLG